MKAGRLALHPLVAGMLLGMLWPQARSSAISPSAHAGRAQSCLAVTSTAQQAKWLAPLDRIVSITTTELPLREALERVAAASGIQLSYSADVIPVHRRVCIAFDRVPVGAALEALLEGMPLRVLVVGATQVVLAPSRVPLPADSADFARTASVLDRVVVTGSPDGALHRATSFALEVIDGATLVAHGITSLGQALELAVPGMWMWSSSPGSTTAQYASIRGASSFGTSAPKVYIDGIEVANPLLVTQLQAERIDRIEVIRGPQGAALHGADAISGVISIITRTDGSTKGSPEVHLTTSGGVSQTDFATRSALVQQHALSVRAGSGTRTAGAGANMASIGAYVPGASELRVLLDGSGRVIHSRGALGGIARLALLRASPTVSPLRPMFGDTIGGQNTMQYTLGATASLMPDATWTVTAVAGVDGFRLRGLSTASLPVPLSLQEDVLGARGGADRVSLRLRGTARVDAAERTTMTFTMAAEQAMLRDATDDGGNVGAGAGEPMRRAQLLQSLWATNSGVVAQGDIAWRDMLYLTAGGRLEQTVGATPLPQQAAMPMIGAAVVRDIGALTLKARGGYGRGIRPAQTLMRGASWAGSARIDPRAALSPESQDGIEVGIDATWGRRVSVHVTRFDQRASGLIQPVASEAVAMTPRPGQPVQDTSRRRLVYVLENVGAIDNRGWELQANARWRGLALNGWLSLVDSEVAQVATGYRGDLRVGDRPLEVPRQTASVSVNWTAGRLHATTTVARASDWVGYDRMRIATVLATRENPTTELTGSQLRRFWTGYDGVTRVRASLGWRLGSQLALQLGGDNLLDRQRGAPDNATIVTGRTVTIGASASF